ncbi:MAG: FAD-binding oxidoreductase [Promethearchaeota archaeon]
MIVLVSVLEKLGAVVSRAHVSDNPYVTVGYSQNVDPVLEVVPDYVVRPASTEEVAEVLKIANEEGIPVTPRGGGCCEFGGSKPVEPGGIVMDLKRMDRVVELDEKGLVVTVEAGASWAQLDTYLRDFGLYTGSMGPGSGMTASIGGGISHHSVGGGGCAKFGACTKQLVSLEVVLPTGEVVETGSQANVYSKKPFGRYGNGPDLSGLFTGGNGILGIITKVSLQVFPRPEFAEYKTFLLRGNTARAGAKILSEIRHRGVDVYDAMYLPDVLVLALREREVVIPWKENKRANKGMFFYTVEGYTQDELDDRVQRLDAIVEENKGRFLGPEISDGNIAKWHYVEQGGWQLYHPLWGVTPTSEPLTAECFSPIDQFSKVLDALDQWEYEHTDEMDQIFEVTGSRPIVGSGPVLLLGENNVEITCGFTTYPHPELRDTNVKLWKSMLELVTKLGVQWYMMGDFCSRTFVEVGGYSPEYYSLLTRLKRVIDPNNVLSRGKFKLLEGGDA